MRKRKANGGDFARVGRGYTDRKPVATSRHSVMSVYVRGMGWVTIAPRGA